MVSAFRHLIRTLVLRAIATAWLLLPATALAADAEQEYQALLQQDEDAQRHVDRLIADNEAFSKEGAGLAPSLLNTKLRQLLDPVRDGYNTFLTRHPQHVKGHLAYASFLMEYGDQSAARTHLERAVALAPDDPVALNNLANFHGQSDTPEAAFPLYEGAIRVRPGEATYHRNCASVMILHRHAARKYYALADDQSVFARALEYYRKAAALAPKDFLLASSFAQAFYHLKPFPYASAAGAWEQALTLANTATERQGVMLHLARIHTDAKNYDEARRNLNSIQEPALLELKQQILARLPLQMEKIPFSTSTRAPSLFNPSTAPPPSRK